MNSRRRGFTLIEVVIATAILLGIVTVTYLLLASSTTEYGSQSAHLALDDQAREVLSQMASELRLAGSNLPNPPADPGPVGNAWWDPPLGSTRVRSLDLTFDVVTGLTLAPVGGGPPQNASNTTIRYHWVPETFKSTAGGNPEIVNGVDDDLDGLIDEGDIEKIVTFRPAAGPIQVTTSTVCRDAMYPREDLPANPGQAVGFWFEWDGALPGGTVAIKIGLQRVALVRQNQGNLLVTRTAQTSASRRN